MSYSASALSERLQTALGRRERSIRSLQKELADKDATVTSYSAVYHYVKGERVPPLAFVAEAASVLGVRPEWLAFGSGEPDIGYERLRRQIYSEDFRRELFESTEISRLTSTAQEACLNVLIRCLMNAESDLEEAFQTEEGREAVVELVRDVIFLIRLPLLPRSWGFEQPRDGLSNYQLSAYSLAIIHSLMVLIPPDSQNLSFTRAELSAIRRARKVLEDQ